MIINPISVYKEAVKAVPSIKYALGVAGIIAAFMLAYSLTGQDPKKAAFGFFFALFGMYLLLIFAKSGKPDSVFRGPLLLIVWSIAILFIGALGMTLSVFAIGKPRLLAVTIGVLPSEYREDKKHPEPSTSRTQSSLPKPPAPAKNAANSRETLPPSQPESVQESFNIKGSSDICDINQIQTQEFCLANNARVTNWSGPDIQTSNCGSSITNIRLVENKANCVAADVNIRGCGYDEFLGLRNCRGSGWIGGTVTVNGMLDQ